MPADCKLAKKMWEDGCVAWLVVGGLWAAAATSALAAGQRRRQGRRAPVAACRRLLARRPSLLFLCYPLFLFSSYEIATHTANHVMMKAGYPWADTVEEIMGAKRFLADECGIPAHTIRGFRSPYLMTNPLVRQASVLTTRQRRGQGEGRGRGRGGVMWEPDGAAACSHHLTCPAALPATCTLHPPPTFLPTKQALFENGFLFDSTLLETGQSESLSKSFGERVWPCELLHSSGRMCRGTDGTGRSQRRRECWPQGTM